MLELSIELLGIRHEINYQQDPVTCAAYLLGKAGTTRVARNAGAELEGRHITRERARAAHLKLLPPDADAATSQGLSIERCEEPRLEPSSSRVKYDNFQK